MNSKERQKAENLPEYEMREWISLGSFGDVEKTMREYPSEGKIYEKRFPFHINGVGDFAFRLSTWRQDDFIPDEGNPEIHEDPSYSKTLIIHTPGGRIESIYGLLRRYERRMESLLSFFWGEWRRKAAGNFVGEEQSFTMQVLTPEGIIYTGPGKDKIGIMGDIPTLTDANWQNEAGEKVIPAVPKDANQYIKTLEVRVIQAESR